MRMVVTMRRVRYFGYVFVNDRSVKRKTIVIVELIKNGINILLTKENYIVTKNKFEKKK